MHLHLPLYPITLLLVLFRFAALVGMTAIFGRKLISVRIRMAIAMALTWFAASHLPPEWAAHCQRITTIGALVMAVLGELLLGAAMGLVCDMFFAVLNMTGLIIGRESSLMMARMMDPASGEDDIIVSTLFGLLLSLLILLWDGHLFLIKLVMQSFQVLPPGFAWFRKEIFEMYTLLGSDIFAWGVRFALPAMVGGLLVAVAMGLMAKMAPEFNVLFLSLPIRLAVGIGLLTIFLLYGRDPLYHVFETMLFHMKYVLLGGV
ncbi:flagellar biosynthetic protein FliR [Pontiella agarivorans]|uniref:Flagellar biosynthetic protein FliR n=1 Tax=Pontiella agarivorans TaxID=3038953 RepID=A0ABU5MST5_9BACT|nr:flagellar biosynthetic protein FliR [Pontiella agarivorans]MDZ8117267.1 flagellar biosynthetic protein FliR [Pontiella agarivorans]